VDLPKSAKTVPSRSVPALSPSRLARRPFEPTSLRGSYGPTYARKGNARGAVEWSFGVLGLLHKTARFFGHEVKAQERALIRAGIDVALPLAGSADQLAGPRIEEKIAREFARHAALIARVTGDAQPVLDVAALIPLLDEVVGPLAAANAGLHLLADVAIAAKKPTPANIAHALGDESVSVAGSRLEEDLVASGVNRRQAKLDVALVSDLPDAPVDYGKLMRHTSQPSRGTLHPNLNAAKSVDQEQQLFGHL
jgi:hypothetical protein